MSTPPFPGLPESSRKEGRPYYGQFSVIQNAVHLQLLAIVAMQPHAEGVWFGSTLPQG